MRRQFIPSLFTHRGLNSDRSTVKLVNCGRGLLAIRMINFRIRRQSFSFANLNLQSAITGLLYSNKKSTIIFFSSSVKKCICPRPRRRYVLPNEVSTYISLYGRPNLASWASYKPRISSFPFCERYIVFIYHLIARRPLPQFTSVTLDRSELRSLRVNREGMNCLRMYLPYL